MRQHDMSILALILFFLTADTTAINVQISQTINTTLGGKNITLRCRYFNDENYFITGIGIQAKEKTNGNFIRIATFYPSTFNREALLTEEGQYLDGRVILSNPNDNQDDAVLTFKEIKCEDNTEYKCDVRYDKTGNNYLNLSNTAAIVVINHPTNPEKIETSVFLPDVVEGQNISFICKGNIGNPPGKFEWKKISYDQKMTTYSYFNSTKENVPENCTWYGTSNLTIQLTAEDNKARVQCEIRSQTDADSMIVTTQEINVFYPVRDVIITTKPSMDTYPPGSSVNLTCEANGNPAPFIYWYRDSDMNNNNVDAGSNLNVNESGTYACFAKNTVNGTAYNLTQTKAITISNGTSLAGDTTASDSKLIVIVATSSGILGIAVAIIILCCCFCKRKRVSPSKDMVQLHLSDSNSESAVQMSQIYSEVKDSFKRCPKTSSEVPVGISEYAEVDPITKRICYKAEKPLTIEDDNIAHEYATVVKHHNII